jgi:hypothetical protein
MAPGIPGERGDTVPQPNAVALKPLGDPQRARPYLGVIRRVDCAFNGAGDHRSVGMIGSRMVKYAMTEQWPILHQTKHSASLLHPGFRLCS